MEPERWKEVERIYHAAMQREAGERSAFLDQASAGDPGLRVEVESLLRYSECSSSPLDRPAVEFVARALAVELDGADKSRRELAIDELIGQYRILAKIGAGGMGEVYRARDSRLSRDVAIKVLPYCFSGDSDRLRRFEQEARAAAALNHPNILAVFQMGTHEGAPYLVSELLEGETLRELIKRGPLSVRKAVDYGAQMAHGLAEAHEKGIVHRDLKPDNLFATKDGRVKILDFGLAKLTQRQPGSEQSSLKLTEPTEAGMVMGTAGYMSPEQVRGQNADYRADIFAIGAVLYEMLTGRRAFQKPTTPETMTAILNEDPPRISQITKSIPPALQRIVNRCLEKNPEQRFQSAPDLAFALDALSESGVFGRLAAAMPLAPQKHWKFITATAIVLALSLGGYLYSIRKPKLTDKDTVVLADFANSTGDPVFDDTLMTALNVSLRQSPFLNVLPESEVAKTLQLMARPAATKLTPEVARELCQRVGSKVYIGGAIGSLGNEYVLGLKAVNCQTGDTLTQQQITATSKEKVLDALGHAASQLRSEVGESLATVQKFDIPLSEATTSSLEALKAESLGSKTGREQGPAAAIPFFQRAVELDPNFASAYLSLGKMHNDSGQDERAKEELTKAYSLREHVSEREKFDIESQYYEVVAGDLEKTIRVYREWLAGYPRDPVALGNLGIIYGDEGQHEQALELTREYIKQSPNDVNGYVNLAWGLMALNRFQEARAAIRDAFDRKLDDDDLHYFLYSLAYFAGDAKRMAEQVAWSEEKPETLPAFLSLESSLEGYSGRVRKSRGLNELAVEAARRVGDKDIATQWNMETALREAAYGNRAEARKIALAALRQPIRGQATEAMGALVFAWTGDNKRAESLVDSLAKRFPQDTLMQSIVLPTVRAQIELSRNNPDRSIKLLRTATPYELTDVSLNGCIYPAYFRGEAYLAANQGGAAAAEFQKILDHKGLVSACPTGVLAHLGLARANVLQSRGQGIDAAGARVRALAAYKDFLTLLKDADPDIPILKLAKAEYARLQT
jgi:serine/threonine protein kinase/tetratricopeptide (TPR) repeat protein